MPRYPQGFPTTLLFPMLYSCSLLLILFGLTAVNIMTKNNIFEASLLFSISVTAKLLIITGTTKKSTVFQHVVLRGSIYVHQTFLT
jgi:hypothetical protein